MSCLPTDNATPLCATGSSSFVYRVYKAHGQPWKPGEFFSGVNAF